MKIPSVTYMFKKREKEKVRNLYEGQSHWDYYNKKLQYVKH